MDGTMRRQVGAAAAMLGIAGVAMIAVSFAVNAGPPAGTPASDLLAFAAGHHLGIVAGAWLQAVGSFALGTFAVLLVGPPLAPRGAALGPVALGASALVAVSLFEVAFYLAGANATSPDVARLSLAFIEAVQHLYFIVAAPAVFVPLGLGLVRSGALPRPFAITALLLGILFFALGIATLDRGELPASVTSLASVQAVWWLAAAVVVLRTTRPDALDVVSTEYQPVLQRK